MTAGELRKILSDIPDHWEVLINANGEYYLPIVTQEVESEYNFDQKRFWSYSSDDEPMSDSERSEIVDVLLIREL